MEEMTKQERLRAALRRLQSKAITIEQYQAEVDAIYRADAPEVLPVQPTLAPSMPPAPSAIFHQASGAQKDRVFAVLRDGYWHDTAELLEKVYGDSHRGTARIGARIADLKHDGYTIESRRKSGPVWEYRITGQQTFA